jgi:hypothetical protein
MQQELLVALRMRLGEGVRQPVVAGNEPAQKIAALVEDFRFVRPGVEQASECDDEFAQRGDAHRALAASSARLPAATRIASFCGVWMRLHSTSR